MVIQVNFESVLRFTIRNPLKHVIEDIIVTSLSMHKPLYMIVVFGASMPNNFTIQDGPYNGEVYQFLQLHFHWGSKDTQGSEHTINGTEYVVFIPFDKKRCDCYYSSRLYSNLI